MGLKIFKIGDERGALELKCDSPTHSDETPTGWFDCGSHPGTLALAMTSGWRERRNAKGAWFCHNAFRGMLRSAQRIGI
jgi:hypothetical protein